MTMEPCSGHVYIARDAEGCVLYVGLTYNVTARMRSHRYTSTWVPLMASLAVSPEMPRADARRLERQAIEALSPIYNAPLDAVSKAMTRRWAEYRTAKAAA